MEQAITLLEFGADGGSYKLILAMTDAGIFSYRLVTNSCFNDFLNKEDQVEVGSYKHQTPEPLVIDWAGAVKLLDDSGIRWMDLYPLMVHPSIGCRIEDLLRDRRDELYEGQFETWCNCIKRGFTGEW